MPPSRRHPFGQENLIAYQHVLQEREREYAQFLQKGFFAFAAESLHTELRHRLPPRDNSNLRATTDYQLAGNNLRRLCVPQPIPVKIK